MNDEWFDFLDDVNLDNICEICASDLDENGKCTWEQCPEFEGNDDNAGDNSEDSGDENGG